MWSHRAAVQLKVFFAILCVFGVASANKASWWYQCSNSTEVDVLVDVIKAHRGAVTSVMLYCGYTVAANGSLLYDPSGFYCDQLVPKLKAMGVGVEMVLNTPAGDPLAPMLAAFGNPQPLVAALVSEIDRWGGLHGWNLDLEPGASSAADAAAYAGFLAALQKQMPATTRVTIAVADWCPMLNNYDLLCTHTMCADMETYNAASFTQWLAYFKRFASSVAPVSNKLVGLGTWVDSSTNNTWAVTEESAVQRFAQIKADNVTEVAMFRLLPSANWPEPFWWPHVEAFVTGQ